MDKDLECEILKLAFEGRNIDAIKLYRERTKCGLKEAKDAFEDCVTKYFSEHEK